MSCKSRVKRTRAIVWYARLRIAGSFCRHGSGLVLFRFLACFDMPELGPFLVDFISMKPSGNVILTSLWSLHSSCMGPHWMEGSSITHTQTSKSTIKCLTSGCERQVFYLVVCAQWWNANLETTPEDITEF